jgi:hypothetical protein
LVKIWSQTEHVNKPVCARRSDVKSCITELRNMRANYSTHHSQVVHQNLETFRSPKLLTIEVLRDHLVRSIPEILAVEWHTHDEERMLITGFRLENSTLLWSESFGVRILGWRRAHKGTWWACYDKVARTVVSETLI